MRLSGSLMLAAVACFVAASADASQGPKAGGGRPATHRQGPKADHPRGPKGDRTAEGRKGGSRGRRAGASDDQTIAGNISRNPQLEARLKAMLPPDMSLEQASEGFSSQGQFIAALEASKNQNIPFKDLKAAMTGDNALSLGEAIQKLRPEAEQP